MSEKWYNEVIGMSISGKFHNQVIGMVLRDKFYGILVGIASICCDWNALNWE